MKANSKKIRYAVVGAGHIAQVAVLPAFQHAGENSRLAAIVSSDEAKHRVLGKKYGVECFNYEHYEDLLKSGKIDAVYIALPNSKHADFAIRAAQNGIHVLCEKPLAVTEAECWRMIQEAKKNQVKLMTAYRLHFEEANMKAVKMAQSGQLGDLRFFNSVFSLQVRQDNIRLEEELGGGPLYDIGIYCINAARYLFQAEPFEVFAYRIPGHDERFHEVEEMSVAVLKFPGQRVAVFTVSFGASAISSYRIVGTKGDLRLDPAYEYAEDLAHHWTLHGKQNSKIFKRKDQFAAEIIYFSNCILKNEDPEPSGEEGMEDVRIIEALYESAAQGRPIKLEPSAMNQRPGEKQIISKPPVTKPETVHVQAASGGPSK